MPRLRFGVMETQGVDVDGEAIKKAIIRGGGRFKKFARGKIIVCTVASSEVKKSLDEVGKVVGCRTLQQFFFRRGCMTLQETLIFNNIRCLCGETISRIHG